MSKISLTATCFEEKIYLEVEEVEEGREKGPGNKNLFDFFDLAVKILPKLDIFPEHKKVNADVLGGSLEYLGKIPQY